MRLPKIIVSLSAIAAIAVCTFAVCSAHAQVVTNNTTLTVTETQQGSAIAKGTNGLEKVPTEHVVMNTAGFITELGTVLSNNFTKAAKLELIEGGANPQFAVSDGTNFVLIETNVMNLSEPTGNTIFSGTMQGFLQPAPTLNVLAVFELDYNDVGMGGKDLQFSLRGIGSLTVTDTKGGIQIVSGKFGMAGDGSVVTTAGTTEFVATGEMSASGKGVLTP